MKFSEYAAHDGLGLAELVKKKAVTPRELVDVAISHIEKVNPAVNAVVQRSFERARKVAKGKLPAGPFAGVPFLLKDLGSFEPGVPSTLGSKICKDLILDEEGDCVKRFREAGFINLGRTNTPEFGLLPTTEPVLHGATCNPWNLEHTVGGSSGGAAAAVAAGMVPIAHGGDGGGSIRIPSSCCGVFGLKPTEGRSPVGPSGGRLWHGLAVENVISRSVRDSAAALDIVSVPQRGAPIYAPPIETPFLQQLSMPLSKLKIAVVEEPFAKAKLHIDCKDGLANAATLCEQLGHNVEFAKIDLNIEDVSSAYLVIVAGETAALLERLSHHLSKKPDPADLEPLTRLCAKGGLVFTAADYAKAVCTMDETRRKVAAFFADYDVVLTPTTALPPPKLGVLIPSEIEQRLMQLVCRVGASRLVRIAFDRMPETGFSFAPYTFLFNLTGQPAMSVPLYWNKEGLPIGSHFAGQFGDEGLLLRLAKQLEEARPWVERRPNLARGSV